MFTKHWTNSLRLLSIISLSVHQGWELLREEAQWVTMSRYVYVCVGGVYFLGQSRILVFRFISLFHYPRALQAWRLTKGHLSWVGNSWLKCSLLVTCLACPSSLCSSLHPINSQWTWKSFYFEEWFITKSPEVSRKIYEPSAGESMLCSLKNSSQHLKTWSVQQWGEWQPRLVLEWKIYQRIRGCFRDGTPSKIKGLSYQCSKGSYGRISDFGPELW